MSVETKLLEHLTRCAQPSSERILDWLVYQTPLTDLPRCDVVCCNLPLPGLSSDEA